MTSETGAIIAKRCGLPVYIEARTLPELPRRPSQIHDEGVPAGKRLRAGAARVPPSRHWTRLSLWLCPPPHHRLTAGRVLSLFPFRIGSLVGHQVEPIDRVYPAVDTFGHQALGVTSLPQVDRRGQPQELSVAVFGRLRVLHDRADGEAWSVLLCGRAPGEFRERWQNWAPVSSNGTEGVP